jgi:hypothetical protein
MSWQEKLDGLFPSGLRVTQIEDVPEGVGQDDDESPTFLTPHLQVLHEEDGIASIRFFIFEFEKDVFLELESLEETSPGVYLAHTKGARPDFLFSTNLSQETFDALKAARGPEAP